VVIVRRLALLAFVGALAAVFAGAADAARPAGSYPETIATSHFVVHFTGNFGSSERVTFQTASDLAALAENAYDTIVTGWGYPAPLNDGDGKTDIWIQNLSALGLATADAPGTTSSAWLAIDLEATGSQAVVAHELLHAIQYGLWIPADSWLLEGTAEWAGFAASNYSPFGGVSLPSTLAAPDMSLDCTSSACGNDLYENGGYSRWGFFQYLSERYGNLFLKDVLARGASLADPLLTGSTLLAGTLAAKGTSLSAVFDDYVLTHLAGGYQTTALKEMPPTTYSSTVTGNFSGALPIQRVAVNHLAARYLKFTRGGTAEGPCYAAKLSLTVGLPAGLSAKPAFFSKSLGSSSVALAINGTTASATIPWDTCTGGAAGYLSLPNSSLATDAQTFTVSGTLTVDLSTITPVGPPPPLYTGATIAAPSGEVAPSIFVYGAQLLRVSAATRAVRLIVFSSGGGKLEASLGGTALGTFTLRAGNNDVRFRLPLSAVKGLRSTASRSATSSLLKLTSLSTTGAKGASVTRKLSIVPAKRG
jgi:hypothetical protein